jgi:hypothetical protein
VRDTCSRLVLVITLKDPVVFQLDSKTRLNSCANELH